MCPKAITKSGGEGKKATYSVNLTPIVQVVTLPPELSKLTAPATTIRTTMKIIIINITPLKMKCVS
jgi:hypothetical protein